MTKKNWKNIALSLQEEVDLLRKQNKELNEDMNIFKDFILLGNYIMTVMKKEKR